MEIRELTEIAMVGQIAEVVNGYSERLWKFEKVVRAVCGAPS